MRDSLVKHYTATEKKRSKIDEHIEGNASMMMDTPFPLIHFYQITSDLTWFVSTRG